MASKGVGEHNNNFTYSNARLAGGGGGAGGISTFGRGV